MVPTEHAASTSPRAVLAAISSDGAHAVTTDGTVASLSSGATVTAGGAVIAAAMLGHAVWLVTRDGAQHVLHRFHASGARAGDPVSLGALGDGVAITANRIGAPVALIEGEHGVLVRERDGELAVEALGERRRDRRVLIGARGVAERAGGVLRLRTGALPPVVLPPDLGRCAIGAAAVVHDGAALLVELVGAEAATVVVHDLRQAAAYKRIRIGDARVLAIAELAGVVVLGRGAHIALLDLRAGRCIGERILRAAAAGCAIDAAAQRLIVVDADGRISELGRAMTERALAAGAEPDDDDEPAAACPVLDEIDPDVDERAAPVPVAPAISCPDPATDPGEVAPALDRLAAANDLDLIALGPAADRALAPNELAKYLADARAWVVSLCRTAHAAGLDSGRLGRTDPPELDAAVGDRPGRAAADLARARKREAAATKRFARWDGGGAPHVELARELGLSPTATSLLLLVAAPQIWGELARAYALCVDERARPRVDELLLVHLLDADGPTRAAIGRELDPDAPLIASGAVAVHRGLRPYAELSAHPAIARRLAGAEPAGDRSDGTSPANRALDEIIGPRAQIAELARRLARPPVCPVRVVLRGRPHAGRRTVAAALAARVGRRIGMVAIDGASDKLELHLAERLNDVSLRGDLPCVTLDGLADDPALRARIRTVLDRHTGAVFLRAPRGGELPLAPGYLAIDFAPLTETERRAAWERTLAAHQLAVAPAAALAARFRIGPGAIARASATATAAAAASPEDVGDPAALEATLAAALRQHRSARIESIATRVECLASWRDLIVPDDIADALNELCARVRHRRTVLEDWGLRGVAASAQGTVALFQGAPGTGKTMAAEVIASELGHELWRVDLSRIVSKWIGETEKNLAAVFDAAEDGEVVLLFDEADSLFGKRTEVKSSHDRNANLETNYLLQRLDSFTGIAILTTNFGTAIDPAFLRRLSVQVQFPLPDEVERERLWRALLPRVLPLADTPNLAELARCYPLTGGYIRNAVLRAAYVAAGRGTPLSTADLERAVRAEYLARGKVSTTGTLI